MNCLSPTFSSEGKTATDCRCIQATPSSNLSISSVFFSSSSSPLIALSKCLITSTLQGKLTQREWEGKTTNRVQAGASYLRNGQNKTRSTRNDTKMSKSTASHPSKKERRCWFLSLSLWSKSISFVRNPLLSSTDESHLLTRSKRR